MGTHPFFCLWAITFLPDLPGHADFSVNSESLTVLCRAGSGWAMRTMTPLMVQWSTVGRGRRLRGDKPWLSCGFPWFNPLPNCLFRQSKWLGISHHVESPTILCLVAVGTRMQKTEQDCKGSRLLPAPLLPSSTIDDSWFPQKPLTLL